MIFLTLLLIPLLVSSLGYYLLDGITWKELAAQLFLSCVIAGICMELTYFSNTEDVEVLNGVVTSKKQIRVSCSHSYSCNCHTVSRGSGKDRYTSIECDTCYEHTNDWDWRVYSNVGETKIARVDRRGSNEPTRWTAVHIGEPFSTTHSYKNYIKAAPGTLLKHQGLVEKYSGHLPAYPNSVHDYYRRDGSLVLVNGARVPDPQFWVNQIAEINGRISPRYQADLVVVLAKGLPQEYFYALEQHWMGGKKNAVVLVIGVNAQLAPKWAAVMSWNTNPIFQVELRDLVMDLPTVTRESVLPILEQEVISRYHRKPMEDFSYLKSSITPTSDQLGWSMVFGLLASLCMLYLFHKHDPFGDDNL